jgi:hypothetical protein
MRTVMRTTDTSVAKDSRITSREMWEIDVVSIMKEDFIEKDKDRSKNWVVTQDGHLFQGIHWVFVGIKFL